MKSITRIAAFAIMGSVLMACSKEDSASTSAQVTPLKQEAAFEVYTAEQFYQTTSIFGSSINANGTAVLVSSDETGVFNAYRVPVDGSAKTPLTQSTVESVFVVSWFPSDDRILYLSDNGGNELDHLYARELDGSVVDLTPGEGLKANFHGWHEDDDTFYVSTNERDNKYFDLYRYKVSDYSRELVYQNDTGYLFSAVSPDGKYLALTKSISNADSNVYLVDLSADEPLAELITAHQGNIEYDAFTFSMDSRQLIYSTDEHGEYRQAWSYDLQTSGKASHYVADWDVSFVYFSKSGRYQVTGINADAQTKLDILDLNTQKKLSIPSLPKGDLRGVNFSKDDKTLIFYVNSDTSPSNLYVHKLGTDQVKRLTESGNAAINENNLVNGEIKRFKSFDGLEIPGILYKPHQAKRQKVPALIWIHGGPGGQSRKGYSAVVQLLVNNGYAVFKINNRGSNGYGKTFFHLDDKKHGDHDLKDVVYNKYYLQTLDWVDKDRIAVIGGSYGGYLTMAAMAFTEEFKAGINIFGVTNWVRTLESIPPYWEAFRKSLYDELGDPATDKERLHNISPVFFGHQVKQPVLVVQGKNDPRVLQQESDDMVKAIREGGTYVDYLIFDDEGHGFSKKDNRISAANKYLSFLKEHL